MNRILAADVGSTTTKVSLFEHRGDRWFLAGKATAPTTVEKPALDVMLGFRDALYKLERATGQQLTERGELRVIPEAPGPGVDAFVASSSAGGGLTMLVVGLVRELTAESAHRAALGAGAVVSAVMCVDDCRFAVESLEKVKKMRPDIILITGGTDGGNVSDVVALAEFIGMAEPSPRFGVDEPVPVVYAGNVDARQWVERFLGESMKLSFVDNVRPELEREVREPVRQEIQRVFLEHVMSRAPGYARLVELTHGCVKPTPVAFADALKLFVAGKQGTVLAVDVGGATTDVFSVIEGEVYRTVSANVGMSYSVGNVLNQAQIGNVLRWLPDRFDENHVRNFLYNKMIRPTTLPQTLDDLILEQAVAREALGLALDQHKSLIRGLKGVQQRRTVSDLFNQTETGRTLVDMLKVRYVIGSGGVLSYAPRLSQAAMMMIDGLGISGVTDIYVDDRFLMPHVGSIQSLDEDIARDIMYREALVPAGTAVCPVGPYTRPGRVLATVKVDEEVFQVISGEIYSYPLPVGDHTMEVIPGPKFDVGAGPGEKLTAKVTGGRLGLILDGRGRPVVIPHAQDKTAVLNRWYDSLKLYPVSAASCAV